MSPTSAQPVPFNQTPVVMRGFAYDEQMLTWSLKNGSQALFPPLATIITTVDGGQDINCDPYWRTIIWNHPPQIYCPEQHQLEQYELVMSAPTDGLTDAGDMVVMLAPRHMYWFEQQVIEVLQKLWDGHAAGGVDLNLLTRLTQEIEDYFGPGWITRKLGAKAAA